MAVTKAVQARVEKTRAGPVGVLLSRTGTAGRAVSFISRQLPPLPSL
jgi:hypothetical protein